MSLATHIAASPVPPSTLVGSGIGPPFPPLVLVLPVLLHDSCVYVSVEAAD